MTASTLPLAAEYWPWLALAGLGAFHGLNPAMGWLFAVALALHRHDRRMVWLSPIPIAVGHAVSVVLVTAAFLWASLVIDPAIVRVLSALFLIGWALYHWRYGRRHRVRFGMQVGLVGLAAWSFLMATAHGAGLMVMPVLLELPATGSPPHGAHDAALAVFAGSLWTGLLAVTVHTLAMLAAAGAIAWLVYAWVGVAVLRRAWINLDLIWSAALIATGAVFLVLAGLDLVPPGGGHHHAHH